MAHAGGCVGRLRSLGLLFTSSCFYQRIHYDNIAAGASTLSRSDQTGVKCVGPKTAFTFTARSLLLNYIVTAISLNQSHSTIFNLAPTDLLGIRRYSCHR